MNDISWRNTMRSGLRTREWSLQQTKVMIYQSLTKKPTPLRMMLGETYIPGALCTKLAGSSTSQINLLCGWIGQSLFSLQLFIPCIKLGRLLENLASFCSLRSVPFSLLPKFYDLPSPSRRACFNLKEAPIQN